MDRPPPVIAGSRKVGDLYEYELRWLIAGVVATVIRDVCAEVPDRIFAPYALTAKDLGQGASDYLERIRKNREV